MILQTCNTLGIGSWYWWTLTGMSRSDGIGPDASTSISASLLYLLLSLWFVLLILHSAKDLLGYVLDLLPNSDLTLSTWYVKDTSVQKKIVRKQRKKTVKLLQKHLDLQLFRVEEHLLREVLVSLSNNISFMGWTFGNIMKHSVCKTNTIKSLNSSI